MKEVKMEVEKSEQPNVVETSVPKVLIEFLFCGLEKDKEKINKKMEQLQEIMAASKKADLLRALYYIDKGEKTDDEKKEWLIENAKCRYYCIVEPTQIIDKDFVKNKLNHIKRFQTAFDNLRAGGLNIKKGK